MIRKLAILLVVVVFGTALVLGVVWQHLHSPGEGDGVATLKVERGATLKPVLDELADRGVLQKPRWLYYYARLTEDVEVRAGEYEIRATDTPLQILGMLSKGQLKMESFTLPEGYDRWLVRDFLVEKRWLEKQVFDRLCDDQAFLKDHGIPGPNCDGYLFPETYTFARGVPAEKLMGEMLDAFQRVHGEVTKKGRGPLDLSMRELTTLASIVEKETGAPEERPRIACVFYNRLMAKTKWRLDTDPTVIYAAKTVDPNFDGNLKRSHLRTLESPYNTYKIIGLPPGPIASAGRAALEAVVTPANCKDFFFVSMNNGRHEFCPTIECHNRAVQKWQIDYFRRR
ncbi:MAG: hypothetical protein A2341_04655 [Deltaproteobacteria bacterium RIFOXYB12_FULL_58_9]|nr:MAG: hypothetical protein A2341_04655 [Deltaproteobacteria bacterium RIFOXYB12_FULL_58_9]